MVIFHNVLPCVNYFDEGGVGDKKRMLSQFCSESILFYYPAVYGLNRPANK